jgi:SM-20-related protein
MNREAVLSLSQSRFAPLTAQSHHPSCTTGANFFRMNIANIAEQLADTGYIVLDQPLLASLSTRLLARCQDDGHVRFQAARIGRGREKQQIHSIRGDVISWLDETDTTDHAYLDWMELLRSGLNEALFLGLFDYECHYAIYGAGTGYAKHSDVLNGNKNRILSTVYYLNEDWQASDGGELVLFEPTGDTAIATVNPTFGTMIIFLSESVPHEVLMAHTKRRSIAGWFRVRELANIAH